MSISHALAELTLDTRNGDIPPSSHAAARKMLLDTLACAMVGADAPGIEQVLSLEREIGAAGTAAVFFHDTCLAMPSAAYVNGAMIHALDFDNNYPGADIHIMSIVMPVAFACVQEGQRTGTDVLDAIILGVEVAGRLARPYVRAKKQHGYFLTTSLVGGWGGVATAARMLGLTQEQTVNAFGIYYAHTSGNRSALLERKLTKRIQPAIGARTALYSAMLAKKGFTGPVDTFEGPAGFYRLYTRDEPPGEDSFRVPPAPYGIEDLVVKKYPTCGIHHPNIVSALHLKRTHGFTYDQIERVEFYLNEGGNTLVSMPFTMSDTPQIDAQFCAPYAIALALCNGSVHVRDFFDDAIRADHRAADLAGRTVEVARFADMKLKEHPQRRDGMKYTRVSLRDGRSFEHACATADVNTPEAMSREDVEEKLRSCASAWGRASDSSIDAIIDSVREFERIEDVRVFIQERLARRNT